MFKKLLGKRERCHSGSKFIQPESACQHGSSTIPTIVIYGDSHAIELAKSLGNILEQENQSILQFSSSACPPALGFIPSGRKTCPEKNRTYTDFLIKQENLNQVILTAFFDANEYTNREELFLGLDRTVGELKNANKDIIIILPYPKPHYDVPSSLARLQHKFGSIDNQLIELKKYYADSKQNIEQIRKIAQKHGVALFDPTVTLCDKESCKLHDNYTPNYYDDNHLSSSATDRIAKDLLHQMTIKSSRLGNEG